jgi:hypothetical protein
MTMHRMHIEARNDAEILFVCAEHSCRRRLVFKRSGGLTVIDQGDFFALHSGGTEGLELSTEVADQRLSA